MSDNTQTVIVTGSSSGIGLDVARSFLEDGANVVLNGRNADKLAAVAAELGEPRRVAAVAGGTTLWWRGRRTAGSPQQARTVPDR